MGDCFVKIQVPFYLWAATAVHGDLPGFQTVLSAPNPQFSVAALSRSFRLLPGAWTWTCASRNNMYYSGTHSFKTNFQVKTEILKVKWSSGIYIYSYIYTHTHIFTVLEIDILLSCVSRAGVTVLLHGLVVKRVYHKWCFWGKICISGDKRLLTACSCVHAHFSYKVKIRINWCVLCELDWICTVTK